jgi:protein-S-isoprenylcysteine O-methyltransferase Ste14
LYSNIVTLAAIALGLWAVEAMKFRVNILPNVREHQKLVATGPYRFIRHPMYAAILLAGLSLVSHRPNLVSVAAWAALLVVLLVKINFEEAQLLKKFPDYREYSQRTKKLIPRAY